MDASGRPVFSPNKTTSAVQRSQQSYYPEVINQVQTAVAAEPVVVVGMSLNPYVKKVRAFLTEKQIPFKYLEFGGYTSKWGERLAIKMWSGWPTFPQVFVRGTLVGGNDDVQAAFQTGELQKLLEQSTA
eukprot:TRINITY_DN10655_c0_g1_i1.p1 TRINITY_DN10655_c0_g1~~TRINITY_DN10655_c0_g1_i1.p1  ORF type:complete len:129 (-),score=14.38 TRINITY_DN10655_c0_g1_i1:137-523(-)